ncbi:hypothetical protein H6F43_20925 [Leptolyngbya sp. FACHB-36]|uniref:hypothetical protein n=1 Tax=Leptolyngbya sp. FACHB-36 TaxID=2692808 RepID=UPI00168104F4|nr:hypothetical protein [Leptolyngbya sp. FACHB-36]MBD2022650.1 hypothetical protein [Leptolyngbya sp. FACHB-36]
MKSDLEALRLTEAELERLSGYDVNDVFVGGLLGGVYRPLIVHHRHRLLTFCFTESGRCRACVCVRLAAGVGGDAKCDRWRS